MAVLAIQQIPRPVNERTAHFGRKEMWNAHNDNDILDFALLWEPLGGPGPDNIATAFSIEFTEFNHRLRSAATRHVARLRHGTTSPEVIYALSAVAPWLEIPKERHRA
ncbi:hypothetical protein I1A62_04200 (plasmid) [Rhodococcus sp. USK10]|uniref:hypothetical protein n=1 Tax=Rhodococcus sp. USK10 TaxID=2789739 RepID=UPI001C5D0901|nr:hypothetical protein [Rhodococcus sp. USK10]QYB00261.1 hypothetical protein I1A62_04200 [Rhodococcus sp. USK10]